MKFLKRFRSKANVKESTSLSGSRVSASNQWQPSPTYGGPNHTQKLPDAILQRIFAEVCPPSQDESYRTSEESFVDGGCALCDLRHLANCALVSRRWHNVAVNGALYRNVRIEPVHYCEKEYELAEKRKRKSFVNRNADPIDAPRERFMLFMRTVRENRGLAFLVHSLRLPYMTRETCKTELARTVSILPNLHYVDLPEAFFSDDPSTSAIHNELRASCPEIRRMKYSSGSERSLTRLPTAPLWQKLEILELAKLRIEIQDLLFVLATFPHLQDLKLVELSWLDDSVFRQTSPSIPYFPAIQRLTLQDTPLIQAAGLASYLSQPRNQKTLKHLSLAETGILPQHLYAILPRATQLLSLSITETIDKPFPLDPPTPQLSSPSLEFLHYEITMHSSPRSPRFTVQPITTSYYTYLSSSILSGSLPSLRELYVRDSSFTESLCLSPPIRPFSNSNHLAPVPSSSAAMALSQPLAIYSKGLEEMEWNFTSMDPEPSFPASPTSSNFPSANGHNRNSSMSSHHTRPLSFSGAENLGPTWGGQARKSVVVPAASMGGRGAGGFLAVPGAEEVTIGRPMSSGSTGSGSGALSASWTGGTGKKERKDLWR